MLNTKPPHLKRKLCAHYNRIIAGWWVVHLVSKIDRNLLIDKRKQNFVREFTCAKNSRAITEIKRKEKEPSNNFRG